MRMKKQPYCQAPSSNLAGRASCFPARQSSAARPRVLVIRVTNLSYCSCQTTAPPASVSASSRAKANAATSYER